MKIELILGENNIHRNSGPDFGGDQLKISITKPKDISNPKDQSKFIINLKIILTPFVPNQELGKPQYFDKIEYYNKAIVDQDVIEATFDVVPEYSYNISAVFITKVKNSPLGKAKIRV